MNRGGLNSYTAVVVFQAQSDESRASVLVARIERKGKSERHFRRKK